jgi:hypothetical protein
MTSRESHDDPVFDEFLSERDLPEYQSPEPGPMRDRSDASLGASASRFEFVDAEVAAEALVAPPGVVAQSPPPRPRAKWGHGVVIASALVMMLTGVIGFGSEPRALSTADTAYSACLVGLPMASYPASPLASRVVASGDPPATADGAGPELASEPTPSLSAPSALLPSSTADRSPPALEDARGEAPVGKPRSATVQGALDEYRRAFGSLDVQAVGSVWPTASLPAIERAFARLASQTVSFDYCDITEAGSRAVASCGGRVTTMAKGGQKVAQVEARAYRFVLQRIDGGWAIQKVEQ